MGSKARPNTRAQSHMVKLCKVCMQVKPLRKFPTRGDECMSCKDKLDKATGETSETTETGKEETVTMTETKPTPTPVPDPLTITFPPGTAPETKVNVKAILAAMRITGNTDWRSDNVVRQLADTIAKYNIPCIPDRLGSAVRWLDVKGYAIRELKPKRTIRLALKPGVSVNDPNMLELTEVEIARAQGMSAQESPTRPDGHIIKHRTPKNEGKTVSDSTQNGNGPAPVSISVTTPATPGTRIGDMPPTPEQFVTPDHIKRLVTELKVWNSRDAKTCKGWCDEVYGWLADHA